MQRGLRLVPELRQGLGLTLLLALVATGGRVVVPLAVQQTLDRGLLADGGPDLGRVAWIVAGCAGIVLVTAVAAYLLNVPAVPDHRDRRWPRCGCARSGTCTTCRCCTSRPPRRGSLVSRVTSDVDQMSVFMQWGGILAGHLDRPAAAGHRADGGLLLAADPAGVGLLRAAGHRAAEAAEAARRRVRRSVRERVGDLLGAVSESVVGAQTVRAYAVEDRTAQRIDAAIDRHYRSAGAGAED